MSWLFLISIYAFIPLAVWGFLQPDKLAWLTFVILGLTLIVLSGYAYDTHRIADQTAEANLRPVVLRSGYIPNWNSVNYTVQGNTITGIPLQFTVWKNIAVDIHGYIVINNHKYTLLFGSPSISAIPSTSTPSHGTASLSQVTAVAFNPQWGWLAPNNSLNALFDPGQSQNISEGDGIYLEYDDIEGNKYFTKEDSSFSSVSGKL